MTTTRRKRPSRPCVLLLAACAAAATARAEVRAFVHEASAASIEANSTFLDDPSANGDPNAILIATPIGGGKVVSERPIGVWYEAGRGRWAVFNQDMESMPAGAAFEIAVASGASAFVHRASATNTAKSSTYLDSPLCNGRPSAALLVTPNWNPGGKGGIYLPHAIGVRYEEGSGRWAVFNQDMALMPEGAAFNVVATGKVEASTDAGIQGAPDRPVPSESAQDAKAAAMAEWAKSDVTRADESEPAQDAKKAAQDAKAAAMAEWEKSAAATPAAAATQAPETVVQPDAATAARWSRVDWDFEGGLEGWTATGTAFESQPTLGDNVEAARVRRDMALESGGIGGDYWKRVPFPVGHHGDYWIGTFENHPDAAGRLGTVQGDAPTGTLTSADFPLDDAHRFIAFQVGGGSDVAAARVELQVRGESDADLAEIEGLVGARRDAFSALAGLFSGGVVEGGGSVIGTRDGSHVIALVATGEGSDALRQVVFDVPAPLHGRRGRIRIVDGSSEPWGHVAVDDFRFGSSRPPDRPPRVWGFADLHTHPSYDLAFGGNFIQGSLTARDGSPLGAAGSPAREHHRRVALPALFSGTVDRARVGEMGPVVRLIASGEGAETLFGATADARSGYPDLRGYPAFNQQVGQMMYGEWIRRAYDGGLRLMTALATNSWLASAHPIKRAVLGSPQPQGDKASEDAQVSDIKAWALRPENSTWAEVALTPADARRIIASNKLAIVLGLEIDLLGNFVTQDATFPERGTVRMPPDSDPRGQRALISAELDRLYATGVRQMTPLHYVSGVFGGCAMFQRMFNEVNRKVTGRNVAVESGDAQGVRYRLDEQDWGIGGMWTRSIASGEPDAAVDPNWTMHPTWVPTRLGHVNAMGLTGAGEILFDEMAQRGMLFDVDHASFKSAERIFELARERRYPVLSSHSDFVELGFTGPGDFSHGPLADDDAANLESFDTTILEPLRHEGMRSRTTLQALGELGGMCAPMLLRSRRTAWPVRGGQVPNDCEGSSRTWAQMYQYAIDVTGGRGVALSTDSLICAPAPRFGPSAAYALGLEHDAMTDRDERRFRHVEAQTNGVRYDTPIVEWRAYRFAPAAPRSAWQKTPLHFGWEERPWEHADAWKAIAAWAAGRNPRITSDHGIESSGDPLHAARIFNFAWGLGSETEADVLSGCDVAHPCLDMTFPERFAGYCARHDIRPEDLRSADLLGNPWSSNADVRTHFRWMKTAWDQWQRMAGDNDPLRRHVFGNRDFDVNLDGVAHYGMLPDFLQDVANSHPRREEVGAYLGPLFRSAEDYIVMWERCRSTRPAARRASDL